MAYETAGASGVNDLLGKLRIFAIAQGWAVDYNGTRGDLLGNALLINKGGIYFAFVTRVGGADTTDPADRFGVYQYPGPYSSGAAPEAQAGASAITFANNMPGPFQAYHFFAGTNTAGQSYLHAVVEAQPGSFRHIGAGVINKLGAVTTGAYTHASRWRYDTGFVNSINAGQALPWDSMQGYTQALGYGVVVRCDADALSPNYAVANNSEAAGTRLFCGIFGTEATAGLALQTPSTLTGRAILLPIFAGVERPLGFYSLIGGPPDLRFVNMENLQPGELISMGPDSWRVFPIIRKNGAPGLSNSGPWGYAYRVVP